MPIWCGALGLRGAATPVFVSAAMKELRLWPPQTGSTEKAHMARRPERLNAPAFIAPMAAQSVKSLPEGAEWLYELKLDGSLYSRWE